MLIGLFTMVLITGSFLIEALGPVFLACIQTSQTSGQCHASLNLTVHNKMAFKIAITCCVRSGHTRMTTWVLFKVLLPSAVK